MKNLYLLTGIPHFVLLEAATLACYENDKKERAPTL